MANVMEVCILQGNGKMKMQYLPKCIYSQYPNILRSKYDNGECNNIRTNPLYSNCDFDDLGNLFDESFSPTLGDGICESNIYNTEACGFEFGDCEECNNVVPDMGFIGDGVCHGGRHFALFL